MAKKKVVRGDGGLIHSVEWERDVGRDKVMPVTACGIWMLNYPGRWTIMRGRHRVTCLECIAQEST